MFANKLLIYSTAHLVVDWRFFQATLAASMTQDKNRWERGDWEILNMIHLVQEKKIRQKVGHFKKSHTPRHKN